MDDSRLENTSSGWTILQTGEQVEWTRLDITLRQYTAAEIDAFIEADQLGETARETIKHFSAARKPGDGRMTDAEFRASLSADDPPAGLTPALAALWHAAKGNWDKAHDITQPGGSELDWVHAYLHRVEGDLGNAGYWYRRAGKPVATGPLDDEWGALASTFLVGR